MRKKPCDLRAMRKKIAAERTAWNTYSIHDRKAQLKRLRALHNARVAAAHKAKLPAPTEADFEDGVRQLDRRYAKFIGAHRYLPHQSDKERARRV